MNPEDESRFTRVSVLGAHRNADVVIPSNAPLDLVMSQIARILGEDVRQGYTLARTTGGALRTSATLAEEGVEDGTILMLTGVDRTPPSPTVFDLSEATEDVVDNLPDRWVGAVRQRGLAAVAGVAIAIALLWIPSLTGLHPGFGPLIASLGLVLLGSLLAFFGSHEAGRVLALTGTAVALLLAVSSTSEHRYVLIAAIALLAAIGTARRKAGWIAGFVALAAVEGFWLGLLSLTPDPTLAAGVLGTVALLVLGILPQIALASSGVFGAQRRTTEMRRATADVLVVRAHDVLRITALVIGLTIAYAVWTLLSDARTNGWGIGLSLALTIGAVLRARSLPLALQKLPLWAVPITAIVAAALRYSAEDPALLWLGLVALGLLAVALLIAAHVSPPEHTIAQLRQIGNSLETMTLVSTIPVLVGQFGLYTQLLKALG